jgi:toxin ParE1/3/4
MSRSRRPKPIHQRPRAADDIASIAEHLSRTVGRAVALRFIDAVEAAYALLAAYPASGSTRHATLLPELPVPLRFHPIKHFERILIYYMDQPDRVEVIRIWDAARGLEALTENSED